MSWRELAQGLEVDTNYSINPEKDSNKDNFQDIQDRSQTIDLHRVPMTDLKKLAEGDWEEIQSDHSNLETFAYLIAIRRLRERGEIPAHYSSKTECQHCGTVPIWEGVPTKVLSCVWCFNRVGGKPMPLLGDSR